MCCIYFTSFQPKNIIQLLASNGEKVRLLKLTVLSSGVYRCEVTTEDSYQPLIGEGVMTVVSGKTQKHWLLHTRKSECHMNHSSIRHIQRFWSIVGRKKWDISREEKNFAIHAICFRVDWEDGDNRSIGFLLIFDGNTISTNLVRNFCLRDKWPASPALFTGLSSDRQQIRCSKIWFDESWCLFFRSWFELWIRRQLRKKSYPSFKPCCNHELVFKDHLSD